MFQLTSRSKTCHLVTLFPLVQNFRSTLGILCIRLVFWRYANIVKEECPLVGLLFNDLACWFTSTMTGFFLNADHYWSVSVVRFLQVLLRI